MRVDNSTTVKFLDGRAMEQVDARRCYRTSGGAEMCEVPVVGGKTETRPLSMRKLIRLGLVDPVDRGERYRLNERGVAALKAWRDSRANPTQ